jgi:beta-galactosidase
VTPPPVPEVAPPIAIAPFKLTEAVSLWDSLPKAIESDKPLTMEDIGQNYGYILYRTRIPVAKGDTGSVTIHDFAKAHLEFETPPGVMLPLPGSSPGVTVDRRLGHPAFSMTSTGQASATTGEQQRFDLLTENTGRINYSHQLRTDRKGVVAYVPPPSEYVPLKWFIYPLPMTDPSSLHFKKTLCLGPCFYRGSFNVDQPGDTFLDTSNLTKGQLWVNGHALGRFWNIGPQKTLYLPGPWLKKGANEVVLFDMDAHLNVTLQGLTKPNLGD